LKEIAEVGREQVAEISRGQTTQQLLGLHDRGGAVVLRAEVGRLGVRADGEERRSMRMDVIQRRLRAS